MLVLTRKIGQDILIGDGIRVVLLEPQRGNFRIGIEAPPDVVILRGEVREGGATRGRGSGGRCEVKAVHRMQQAWVLLNAETHKPVPALDEVGNSFMVFDSIAEADEACEYHQDEYGMDCYVAELIVREGE